MMSDGDTSGDARQVGNYRLHSLLSSGQDASTYYAEHIHLKTHVLLKLYEIRLQASDQEDFLAEIRAAARLIHPHITRILEFGVEEYRPFLVMAYTPGGTLRERHPVGIPLPFSTILSYVKQIAAALDYAHSQQLLHLDLKPENIWLNTKNEVQLSNFRVTLFSHSSHTQDIQAVMHAAAYMAPEQIQGHAGPASDQYALGILVYEWLSGSRPFTSTNYVEIARQHLYTTPPTLSGKVSPAVEQVVMRALAKEASERFPNVQAFADALEQGSFSPAGVKSKKPSVQASSSATPTTHADHVFDPSLQQSRKGSTLSRRNVALGITGLAGATAIGGGITYWLSHRPPAIQPQPPAKPVPVGTTLHIYRGHVDSVYGVAWSHDGKSIASWSRDDTMQIWNTATFSTESTSQMEDVLSWSPDWHYIASGNAYHFQIWETLTGRLTIAQDFPNTGGGPSTLAANKGLWSPDSRYFTTPLFYTQIWDVVTGKILSSFPAGDIAWSVDSKRIALAPVDYASPNAPIKVRVLELKTENQIASYSIALGSNPPGVSGIGPLAWSPNGKYLVSGKGNIWDAITGRPIVAYKGNLQRPSIIEWSPDSRYLASTGFLPTSDGQGKLENVVHVWSAGTGNEVFLYRGHSAPINDIVWSPDGTKIASASDDKTVRVWQAI